MSKIAPYFRELDGLERVAENTFVGTLIVSTDFNLIMYCNSAVQSIFGVSCGDAALFDSDKEHTEAARRLLYFLRQHHSPLIDKYGFSQAVTAEYPRLDGSAISVRLQFFKVRGGVTRLEYYYIHAVDVTNEITLTRHLLKIKETHSLIDAQYISEQEFQKALILRYQLTPAEAKVALWVWKGETSKTLANRLGVSAATINVHRRSIRRKMGLLPHRSLFAFLSFLAADLEN